MTSAEDTAGGGLLDVATLSLGPIGTNCYVVRRAGENAAVVIDPGAQAQRVIGHVREHGLGIEALLVTHCHYDHIGAVAQVARVLQVPVYVSAIEAPALRDPDLFAPGMQIAAHEPEHELDGGEHLSLGGIGFDVLHLPGHSPGTMGFLVPGTPDAGGESWLQPPVLFVGDVVFAGSIGRYDLPFSDGQVLFDTIRQLMDQLDGATVLYSGHGPATTMGRERASNPFLLQLA